ncbi:hypothetical protein Hamer_G009025 [Homarus americanus]|uniref:Uncharacterized protein n=1 Tax=Homarus americanus TaxID=6706 RepID=A0A8J5NAY4_HOMAM|nr:hypothetical protein Hamer_G009025 [Homarus americanus]
MKSGRGCSETGGVSTLDLSMGKTDAVQDDLATCIFIKSLRHHHSSPVCHDTSRHSNMCECHRRYRNSSSASSSSSTSTPNLASSKSTTNGFNNNHNKQALKEKLMASDKNAKNFSLSSNRYKNYKGSPKWKMDGRSLIGIPVCPSVVADQSYLLLSRWCIYLCDLYQTYYVNHRQVANDRVFFTPASSHIFPSLTISSTHPPYLTSCCPPHLPVSHHSYIRQSLHLFSPPPYTPLPPSPHAVTRAPLQRVDLAPPPPLRTLPTTATSLAHHHLTGILPALRVVCGAPQALVW